MCDVLDVLKYEARRIAIANNDYLPSKFESKHFIFDETQAKRKINELCEK